MKFHFLLYHFTQNFYGFILGYVVMKIWGNIVFEKTVLLYLTRKLHLIN